MTWLSIVGSIFYYLTLPIASVFGWLLVAIAPLLHLGQHLLSGLLLPLRLLARFEVTAHAHAKRNARSHIFPEDTGRSAASVRAARENKKLEDAWQSSSSRGEASLRVDPTMEKKYAEWLEKDIGKRREDSILGQTILEEDDDSEDVF
ncbi:hypothetical protein D0Z07_5423 [Hyphodiscus hymeniophilus]|uniref:Uncharacterized protein n=1 Tax=Hyphodiscus hymeniophilus TaxID=353542 RepID=A0A9P6VHI3_9HELO|nr:hypothetical protein D0Z07_5423 [Hyphodiscus hymeniophilus]